MQKRFWIEKSQSLLKIKEGICLGVMWIILYNFKISNRANIKAFKFITRSKIVLPWRIGYGQSQQFFILFCGTTTH